MTEEGRYKTNGSQISSQHRHELTPLQKQPNEAWPIPYIPSQNPNNVERANNTP